MSQVNVFKAKTDFSRLIAALESRQEDEIVIARNGKPVARLVPWTGRGGEARIGAAKGRFTVPDDFNHDDAAIAESFFGTSL